MVNICFLLLYYYACKSFYLVFVVAVRFNNKTKKKDIDAWEIIKKEGLSRMNRKHIHFATEMMDSKDMVSGMRSSCEVFIRLDVAKALQDGIELFISENKVILTEGHNGVIEPKYFACVEYNVKRV